MKNLVIIISLFSLFSCSIKHDKEAVMNKFSDIKKLNQIIVENNQNIDWEDDLNQIKTKAPNTIDLIKKFESELDLTEIIILSIDGIQERLGIVYKFGENEYKSEVNYLIFSETPKYLGSLCHYEQFIDCGDCGDSEKIDENWAFSYTNLNDCDD